MVAALTRVLGVHNIALAEDVVQDAFCRALDVWKFSGMPENPSAWLMSTARNRALDVLRRERTARVFAPELSRFLESEGELASTVKEAFGANAIRDDLLRMMFSCCHPRVPEIAQVALILQILCGFSIEEIGGAFVCSRAAIEKRIQRGKKVLARSSRLFDLGAPTDFSARLPAVQRALYLLFNEGYHGASAEFAVRIELCEEAIRLAAELLRHPLGAVSSTYALSALMCLHRARLPGRVDGLGNLSSLPDQDRSLWDQTYIGEGLKLLECSATGSTLSEYHLEAAIASHHATTRRAEDTDWQSIVSLYDVLMRVRPSPIVALNRAIAIAERDGSEEGLGAIQQIDGLEQLSSYPFYPAALGELHYRRGNYQTACGHFRTALSLARNPMERNFLEQRVGACDDQY